MAMENTMQDALLAELLGDVGTLYDEIKGLNPELNKLIVEAPAAISKSTAIAVSALEKCAEAQTYWIEQETLKDRSEFLTAQKALYDSWRAEMDELMKLQAGVLESVIIRSSGITANLVKIEVKAAFKTVIVGIKEDAEKRAAIDAKGRARVGVGGVVAIVVGTMLSSVGLLVGTLYLLRYLNP